MSSVIRVKKTTNYVVLDKTALNDPRLSWKAKGIIAFMLSKPDDWTFYLKELMSNATDGEDSFRSGFNELKKHGYVKRVRNRDEKGKIRWETLVFEKPQLDEPHMEKPHVENPHVEKPHMEKPHVENPHVGKPRVENPALLNNELLSNEKLNNELLSNDKHNVPFGKIVSYLNSKCRTNFRPTAKETQRHIYARWKEGYRFEDFVKVIDNKALQWLNDPEMSKYLRPKTLFGENFESYLNEKGEMVDKTKIPLMPNKNVIRQEKLPEWFSEQKEGSIAKNFVGDTELEKRRKKLLEIQKKYKRREGNSL